MRWLLRIALLLVAFIVLFGAGVFFLLPTERIVALAADKVREMTGRTLTIGGDVTPTFWPVIGVSTGRVALSNAEWAETPEMVTAAAADIGVEILPLLGGEVRVSRLTLVEPVINLEIGPDGAANWEFPAGGDAEAAGDVADAGGGDDPLAALRAVSLEKAVVENGVATFANRVTGERVALSSINLTAAFPGLAEPFTADGEAIWNGLPAGLRLVVETPEAALSAQRFGLIATAKFDGSHLSFDGEAAAPADGAPPALKGKFELISPTPADTVARLGLAGLPPEIADLSGVGVNGDIALVPEQVVVKINGRITFRERLVSLRATADSGAEWMAGGPVAFSGEAKSDGLFALSGQGQAALADGGALDARFEASAPDPAALAAWTGAQIPEGEDLADVALILDVDAKADGIAVRIDGGGARNGRKVTIEGAATGGPDWRAGGAVAIDGRVGADGLFDLSAKGDAAIGDAPGFAGAVDFASADLAALTEWAGVAFAPPEGAPNTASVAGRLRADAGSVALSGAEIALGDIAARGDLSAALGGRPAVTARLETGPLDLRPFMAGGGSAGGGSSGGGSSGGAGAGAGWSKAPIDLSGLNAFDAEIALSAPAIVTPDFALGESVLEAVVRNGALTLDIRKAEAFGGGIAGALRVDGPSGAVAADIDASGVQLRPLLNAFAGTDRIEGTGAFRLSVTSRGDSVDAIMNGLNGSGAIDLRDGALIGVNLAAMVRNATGAFQGGSETASTDFSSITGTFTIAGGVLSNSDLVFLGPLLRISGAGEVGLGAQTVNYRVTPKAVATLEGQGGAVDAEGLTFPVIVTGPWSDLSFAPDLGSAIEGLLKDPGAAKRQVESVVEGVKNLDAGAITGILGGGAPAPAEGDAPADAAPVEKDPIGGLLKGLLKQ